MFNTGLPYDLNLMNDIAEQGAIVDMNNINFPGIPENLKIKTSFIFLRNTGFENISLDFFSVNYEEKEKFLLFFLTGDIESNNQEFIDTWLSILFFFNEINNDIITILDKDEIEKFIKNNNELILKISSVINSLPVMLINRLKNKPWNFNIQTQKFGNINIKNLAKIISTEEAFYLYTNLNTEKYQPVFYEDLFSEEENDLFFAMTNSPLFVIMFGLSTTPTEELETLIKNCAENLKIDEEIRYN